MGLQLHQITKRFGGQLALSRVSLHVRAGDCYGFLGHNGAGKTTALRIALGLMRPDEGRVTLDGFEIAGHPAEARARIGGLIETPGFHPSVSGLGNLRLLARLQGLGRSETGQECERVLDAVGLSHAAGKPVRAYSQGMRQRLGIAQALLGKPPYVLLDEPTNGLDPEGIEEMRALLRRITREDGATVLLSSHQLHELAGLCNRVAILREGHLLVEEEMSALLGDAGERYELRTPDGAQAGAVLDALGISVTTLDDALFLTPGRQPAAEIAAALVGEGVRLEAFAPRPPSLEEVYLRFTRGAAAASSADAAPTAAEAAAPTVTRAPGGALVRVVRHELTRWRAGAGVAVLLAAPAVLAVGGIGLRWREARAIAAEMEGGQLFSSTAVTAFEGVGVGLGSALPLAAVVLAGLASQSLAGELSRGTLRNTLLRPLTRVRLAIGKFLALLLAGWVAYAALAAAALGAAWALFDFSDVAEILPNGEPYVLVEADALWTELREVLIRPLLPLTAYVGIGFLAGAVTRTGAGGLGLATGSIVFLELLRVVGRALGFESWLPSAHLPSPLGDSSHVGYYLEIVQGVSNATEPAAASGQLVPLAWTLATAVLSVLVLVRREVK